LKRYYKTPGNTEAIRPFYKKLMNALEMRDDRYASFAMAELLTFAEMGIKEIMGAEAGMTERKQNNEPTDTAAEKRPAPGKTRHLPGKGASVDGLFQATGKPEKTR
jgi:hypothetical protein